jgi:hypothetical protein
MKKEKMRSSKRKGKYFLIIVFEINELFRIICVAYYFNKIELFLIKELDKQADKHRITCERERFLLEQHQKASSSSKKLEIERKLTTEVKPKEKI